MYSGFKDVCKNYVKCTGNWGITFEIEDAGYQDLDDHRIRQRLARMVELGVFRAFGAAPVCASFSLAITPPVRTNAR